VGGLSSVLASMSGAGLLAHALICARAQPCTCWNEPPQLLRTTHTRHLWLLLQVCQGYDVMIYIQNATNLPAMDWWNGRADPYVIVTSHVGGQNFEYRYA